MAFQNQMFEHSGPLHLRAVDWNNPDHRRSVAASLVQGVYSLEHDRLENRQWHQALAPLWGDYFNFKLIRSLVDNADHSIFGAIYEFKSPPPNGHRYNPRQSPPRYVVALRGTMTKWETMSRDLKLDVKVIRNTLERDPRFRLAMQAVRDTVSIAGAANMRLAGHSLGSAMALLAGKNMAKMGFYMETYLFNPPFIAVQIEMMTNTQILKHGVRVTRSVMTAGVAIALDGLHQRPCMGDWFAMLSGWVPYLFVNPSDPISTGYVGYFGHREWMAENGAAAAAIESLATRNTISGASQPLHLLPSAYLTTNVRPGQDFRHSHGLEQWWTPNIQCQSKLHQYFR
ncbi:GDSL esterase/lipase At4g10955-like [Rhododendron vialii]|uniref:GDSL esterase/lipase At4g10955-like n=1 Tax=Rhododendron vialii TaxID=182163 RepID=UPI00265E9653|nr:GDSL esterase/lipase At4g10955-like [Rhododendron vialii]